MTDWKSLRELFDKHGECNIVNNYGDEIHFLCFTPNMKIAIGWWLPGTLEWSNTNLDVKLWKLIPKTPKVTLYRYTMRAEGGYIWQSEWSAHNKYCGEAKVIKTETKEIEVEE